MGQLMRLLPGVAVSLPVAAPVQKDQDRSVLCLAFLFEFPHSGCCLVSPVPFSLNVLLHICEFVWVCIGAGLNSMVHKYS